MISDCIIAASECRVWHKHIALKSIRDGARDREGDIYIYIERERNVEREQELAAIMDADHPRCLPVDPDRLIGI